MKTEGYIIFEKRPKSLKVGTQFMAIQYEFSGIQSFIFGNSNMKSTSAEIRAKSAFVSDATESMKKWIQKKIGLFAGFQVLSQSSGKLICGVSKHVGMKKILALSNELQRIIYMKTAGKLEMFYGVITAEVTDNYQMALRENAMSMLTLKVNENKFHCTNVIGLQLCETHSFEGNAYDGGVHMDEGMWMAVKLDLDNLGSFFQQIIEIDKRRNASNALARVLENVFCHQEKIVPIFVGGDDLFAVVKMEGYLSTISRIFQNIKEGIKKEHDLELYKKVWGISGGSALIRNDLGNVPLLYYFESSEEQLEKAKNVKGKNAISIEGTLLSWQQLLILSEVFERNRKEILEGLEPEQKVTIETNVRELKTRVLNLNRWSDKKIMTSEEEKIVGSIG